MPRSVNAVASRARRKKMMKHAKGYFGRRKNVWTIAKNAVEKAWEYAYRDRKTKKRNFRSLWIVRINAAAFIRTIHNERKFLFLVFRSLYAYSHAFSTAFLAIVHTFLRRPKYPLACFIIFFLRALEATAFTDLGIFIYCFEGGGRWFYSFKPTSGLYQFLLQTKLLFYIGNISVMHQC